MAKTALLVQSPLGPDDPGQMIALCPNCHAIKTRGRKREQLRQALFTVARQRHIAAGTPVVEICRVAIDANGLPVEANEMADSSACIYEFSA